MTNLLFINRGISMFRGGGETYTLNLAHALEKRGVSISFLVGQPLAGALRYPITEYPAHYVISPFLRDIAHRITLNSMSRGRTKRLRNFLGARINELDRKLFEFAVLRWLKSNHHFYHIIQVLGNARLSANIKHICRNPVVVFFPGPPSLKDVPFLNQCDAIVTDGAAIEELRRHHSGAIQAINGIDTSRFKKAANDLRQKLEIAAGEVVYLFVGRFVPLKNLFSLVDAFSLLKNDMAHARLILAGEGPLDKDIRRYVEIKGLNGRVLFTGFIKNTEVAAYYSAADIFVLSSAYENSPNVLLEAMACELPIIANDVGGISFLLPPHNGNKLLTKHTPASWASAMLELGSVSSEKRQEWGKCNRSWCETRFSWGKTADIYYSIYQQIEAVL